MTGSSNNNKNNNSVLIIGSTGATGMAVVNALDQDPSKPRLNTMVRNADKLRAKLPHVKFDTISQGNAREAADIEKALRASKSNWIVLSVGNGENLSKNDIRAANATATVQVLKKPEFQHVRAVVVSSTGAGSSKIKVGFGIGAIISCILRHVLADHTEQEKTFGALSNHVTIIRATSLTEDHPTGKLVTFGDHDKSPTIKTDRADLAAWIANEICGTKPVLPSGGTVNVTGVKTTKM